MSAGVAHGVSRGRVAVVAYTEYSTDGRVRNESEILARQGYDVYVIAATPKKPNREQPDPGITLLAAPIEIRRGGKIRYSYQYMMFFLFSVLMLAKVNRQERVVLVHVHSLPDFQVFCALGSKLHRTPVILDLHEALPEIIAARFHLRSDSPLVRFAGLLEQVSCRFASHVIVANDGIRSTIIKRGAVEQKITSVYNTGGDRDWNRLRKSAASPPGLPTGNLIVHAGGINPERDIQTLVYAVALLPKAADVHVVLLGEGDPTYISSILELSERIGVGDRVHYLGKVSLSESQALMAQSIVGLVTLEDNPLTRLAWPTRIVEFARLHKPLLVPDLPFLRTKLGEAATYYRPGNPRSLADSLASLESSQATKEARMRLADQMCEELDQCSARVRLPAIYRKVGA